uniref:Uncharacterized protein n=1 Tax=Anguilla anguilla TaxID=7936 RepID=A0A0E9UKF9_ANGAN
MIELQLKRATVAFCLHSCSV